MRRWLSITPAGTVRVKVTGATGGPAPEDARVSLRCKPLTGEASRSAPTAWWRDAQAGVQVYEDIGTGLALTV